MITAEMIPMFWQVAIIGLLLISTFAGFKLLPESVKDFIEML